MLLIALDSYTWDQNTNFDLIELFYHDVEMRIVDLNLRSNALATMLVVEIRLIDNIANRIQL